MAKKILYSNAFSLKNRELRSKLEERQQKLLGNIKQFVLASIGATVILMLIYTAIKLKSNDTSAFDFTFLKLNDYTLQRVISLVITVFSNFVSIMFVLWTLFFIPYIAYQSYRISQKISLPIGRKPFKFMQLILSTFFPAMIFAVIWGNLPPENIGFKSVQTLQDVAFTLIIGIVVWAILFTASNILSNRYIYIYTSLLSVLLFASLLLNYGLGVGAISYGTLFGILFFLTFNFPRVEEIGRVISMYDLDFAIIDKFNSVIDAEDEIETTKWERELQVQKYNAEIEHLEIESQHDVNRQLQTVEKFKLDFNARITEEGFKQWEMQLQALDRLQSILSEELNQKISRDIPTKIASLAKRAEGMSSDNLHDQINQIRDEILASFDGPPEVLEDIRQKFHDRIEDVYKQTKKLSGGDKQSYEDTAQ